MPNKLNYRENFTISNKGNITHFEHRSARIFTVVEFRSLHCLLVWREYCPLLIIIAIWEYCPLLIVIAIWGDCPLLIVTAIWGDCLVVNVIAILLLFILLNHFATQRRPSSANPSSLG